MKKFTKIAWGFSIYYASCVIVMSLACVLLSHVTEEFGRGMFGYILILGIIWGLKGASDTSKNLSKQTSKVIRTRASQSK